VKKLNYVDAQPATSVGYTVTASPANGRLELSSAPGVAITVFTQADINAGLVRYVRDGSETAGDSFTFNVSDGVGGTVVGQTFTFVVTAVNDTPVNTVSGALTTELNTPIVFTGANLIAVSDVDAGVGAIRVDLVVGGGNGTLTLATTVGVAVGPGADGTSAMTLTGTLAAINAALNGMTFTPNLAFQGATSVQIATDDLGNTGLPGAADRHRHRQHHGDQHRPDAGGPDHHGGREQPLGCAGGDGDCHRPGPGGPADVHDCFR
jgi:hypothetical protein